VLGAIGEAALGVKNTSQWSRGLDNLANRRFVETFEAEYGRLPSLYASQGYDTANLILSAAAKTVKEPDAFHAALETADFQSVRGDFKFGNNNHPIQDIYVREVVKEGMSLENHQDAYAKKCRM
jgi:branched-chain amino acid transport system substrate-binding protein